MRVHSLNNQIVSSVVHTASLQEIFHLILKAKSRQLKLILIISGPSFCANGKQFLSIFLFICLIGPANRKLKVLKGFNLLNNNPIQHPTFSKEIFATTKKCPLSCLYRFKYNRAFNSIPHNKLQTILATTWIIIVSLN